MVIYEGFIGRKGRNPEEEVAVAGGGAGEFADEGIGLVGRRDANLVVEGFASSF